MREVSEPFEAERLDIAARGLRHSYELPVPYRYADSASVGELTDLLRLHYPGGYVQAEQAEQRWLDETAELEALGTDFVDIGIRREDRLVAFHRLAWNAGRGVLTNLIVHSEHRRRGLAKLLVAEGVHLADEVGIVTLLTEKDARSPLDKSYTDMGFRQFRKTAVLARTSSANSARFRAG